MIPMTRMISYETLVFSPGLNSLSSILFLQASLGHFFHSADQSVTRECRQTNPKAFRYPQPITQCTKITSCKAAQDQYIIHEGFQVPQRLLHRPKRLWKPSVKSPQEKRTKPRPSTFLTFLKNCEFPFFRFEIDLPINF